jgi:hypothetical protein
MTDGFLGASCYGALTTHNMIKSIVYHDYPNARDGSNNPREHFVLLSFNLFLTMLITYCFAYFLATNYNNI